MSAEALEALMDRRQNPDGIGGWDNDEYLAQTKANPPPPPTEPEPLPSPQPEPSPSSPPPDRHAPADAHLTNYSLNKRSDGFVHMSQADVDAAAERTAPRTARTALMLRSMPPPPSPCESTRSTVTRRTPLVSALLPPPPPYRPCHRCHP